MNTIKSCVILSMDDTSGFVVSDELLEQPFKDSGWHCKTISWRAKDVDWDQYDLVMIRSPWDYQLDAEHFLSVLDDIDRSSAHLDNPLKIVRWNINKKYLLELNNKGIEIVPTIWKSSLGHESIEDFFEQLDSQQIVIKPCVSAGAFDTYWLKSEEVEPIKAELIKKFSQRECMIQPFMPAITEEGEFSLFYFDGEYSHTILKTPKPDDFRVQEEYGSRLLKVEPDELLKNNAEKVLSAINCSLLYARLDFVRSDTGYALMEAELIEPSLYFNLDPESPLRYVEAVDRRMKRLGIVN